MSLFLILLRIKYLEIGGVKDHLRKQKKQANLNNLCGMDRYSYTYNKPIA